MRPIFWLLSLLPLTILHILGSLLGWLMYCFGKKNTALIRTNLNISKIYEDYQDIESKVKSICQHTCMSGLELPIAWLRSPKHISTLFHHSDGWEHVQTALEAKKGLLFITPHIGSYDLAGRYISHQLPFPLTAMYRPPKLKWLEPIMNAGRQRDKGRTAPANAQGVRLVLKALKNAEATIVLPDQVPSNGEGVWAPFFSEIAYTMTLAARLAQVGNVATFFFIGERLPHSQGFCLHIKPLIGTLTGNKEHDATIINQNVEALIKEYPEQYLFSYNRYKTPRGVIKPEE
ncbi:lysophospholipid acyltransferase family protein [Neisseria sp. Ec49-e6-T10]|uniref:lysophospholipid acyltransferase family protein n=1 Tax=Neisseria sp. Ec49-e6-T10 TaxID=3140744 RepID=UPI003EB8936C